MVRSGDDRSEGRYLSRLFYVVSLIVSVMVFLVLPLVLSGQGSTVDEVRLSSYREAISRDRAALPVPTSLALTFTDMASVRIAAWFFLILLGTVLEVRGVDRRVSGTFHAACLLLCLGIGSYFFIGCLLPWMPLRGV